MQSAAETSNPIRRFTRWLGWSEDQYLTALGYLPLVAAFVAGVVLSYTSLTDLAGWLGFGHFERPFFPFAIDALVLGCYIAQARLAGLPGFGPHRLYIIALGLVAGVLTASGNALHGLIAWAVVTTPLPWPILVAGSLVPALAMVGVGHAFSIIRSASKARRVPAAGVVIDQQAVPAPALEARAQERALPGPEPVPTSEPVQADRALVPVPKERAKRVSGKRAQTAPKREPRAAQRDRVRAVLAEPGGRELTGAEIATRLELDPSYVRKLRQEVLAENAPALSLVANSPASAGKPSSTRSQAVAPTATAPKPARQQQTPETADELASSAREA